MPLDWQSIQRLLLVWSGDHDSAKTQLETVYACLTQALPQANIWLLTEESTEYQLHHILATKSVFEASCEADFEKLIGVLQARSFEAAIFLTQPGQSPYQLAYLCYLASIPHRIGQSVEFGGGVLSWPIEPLPDPVPLTEYQLHLLKMAGIFSRNMNQPTDSIHSLCI